MTDFDAHRTEADAIAQQARLAAMPDTIDRGDLISLVVNANDEHVLLDTEWYLDAPRAKRGHPTFHDAESLIVYLDRHCISAQTVVYGNEDRGGGRSALVAVIDDHGIETDGAAWGCHRATLALRQTDAWKRWTAHDGALMGQVAFAEHLEDSQPDVVEPPAARLLEIALKFEASNKVTFESASRLDSGERRLVYTEDVQASGGGRAELRIPEMFTLRLAPFEGGDDYEMIARLRYRIGSGALQIGYRLDRPTDVAAAAFKAICDRVADEAGVPVLRGTPRAVE